MQYIDDDDEALSQIREKQIFERKEKKKRMNLSALHVFLYTVSKVKRRTSFHSRDLVLTVGGFQIVLKRTKT